MSHVATVLDRWLLEFVAAPEEHARAYHDDITVLSAYLERIYGAANSRLVLDEVGHADAILESIAVLPEVLQFPVWSGLDPRDEETAEWALFAVRRGVEIHPDIYQPLGRFEKRSSVKRLIAAGVPLAYAKELDITRWGDEYPVEGVITSWLANLAPEYARVVVFEGVA